MRVFFNSRHDAHDGAGEMHHGRMVPCFENARRIPIIRDAVAHAVKAQLVDPADHGMDPIRAIHDPDYLDFIENAWAEWTKAGKTGDAFAYVWPTGGFSGGHPKHISARLGQFAISSDTPITQGTWKAAYWGAQTVASAADATWNDGEASFALTRPPGHHAHADLFGGYCFFNNAAIVAQAFRDQGYGKVAVLDVDFHHGNGTQAIFYDRNDVLTISLHGDPDLVFPHFLGFEDEIGEGAGEGYNLNIVYPPNTPYSVWSQGLETACERIQSFKPDALVVALGVDTFEEDPISFFKLNSGDYLTLGQRLAALGLPTVFTMEGGYDVDAIGVNAVNVMQGFDRAAG